MEAADAGDAGENAVAAMPDFLQIGLKTAQAGDVFVGTQHFPGVANQLLFTANLAYPSHGKKASGKKKKNQDAR